MNAWVKQGILLGFRLGALADDEFPGDGDLSFVDKHTYPARRFTAEEGVRVVPGGLGGAGRARMWRRAWC